MPNEADVPAPDAGSRSLLARWQLMGTITQNPAMTAADAAVAWMLLERTNVATGDAWPSLDTIAAETNRRRSTIAESVRRLVDHGYFIKTTGGGRGQSTHYRPALHRAETVSHSGQITRPNLSAQPDGFRAAKPSAASDPLHKAKLSAQPNETVRSAGLKLSAPADPNLLIEPAYEPSEEYRSAKGGKSDLDEAFESWWQTYPRKASKGAARQAFGRALKKASIEALIAGATRYATERCGADPKFTRHAATWLNGECWLDEPSLLLATPSNTSRPNGGSREDGVQAFYDRVQRSAGGRANG